MRTIRENIGNWLLFGTPLFYRYGKITERKPSSPEDVKNTFDRLSYLFQKDANEKLTFEEKNEIINLRSKLVWILDTYDENNWKK